MQDNYNTSLNAQDSSYVNISSSVLRNKFEKNRILHLQTISEKTNVANSIRNEEIDNLKKIVLENDNKIQKCLSDSNNIDSKICILTESFTEKIDRLTESIHAIQSKMSEFYSTIQKIDYSENIKTINLSIEDIKKKLSKVSTDLENNKVKLLSDSIEDIKKKLSEVSTDLENNKVKLLSDSIEYNKKQLSEVSTDLENNKVKLLSDSIDEVNNKLSEVIIKNKDTASLTQISIFENKIQENIDNFSNIFNKERNEMDIMLKLVIDNLLPKDFDWKNYRDLNEDLKNYNEFELKKHYLIYGMIEERVYFLESKNLPEDFYWKEYLQMNIDIASSLTTATQAENHYLKHGNPDKRMYKMSQLEDVNFFVFSGRKSGSSTLNHSFLCLENIYSIQIHNNEDFLYKYGQCNYNSIFDLIDNNLTRHKKIYIFDSYRTPIEKKISSFFEDIDKYIPNYKDCDISFLITYFNKKYIYGKNCSHIYTEDYEPLDEIMEYYNLPRISNFDFDKKYTLVQHKNLIFVKLRFNEINKWDEILYKIVGRPVLIKDKNKSENKSYYDVYNNFKKHYKIPKEFLEKLKTDTRFNVYNSKAERIKYIKDWSLKTE
jgi:hypothetical protein